MKLLQKTFNILSSKQEKIVQEQVVSVKKIINEQEDKLYREKRKYKDEHETKNKICIVCSSTKIADKKLATIRNVTDGFSLLFGVRSHSESAIKTINRCIDCGNEWEKYCSWDDDWKEKRNYFEIFSQEIKDKKEFRFSFGEAIKPYMDFYAESIHYSFKDKCKISLSQFRKIFKSIFDDEIIGTAICKPDEYNEEEKEFREMVKNRWRNKK